MRVGKGSKAGGRRAHGRHRAVAALAPVVIALAPQAGWAEADASLPPVVVTASRMPEPADKPALTPAARRALAEAEARRAEIDARTKNAPPEKGGRGGLDPIRYGDWEIKGLTSDF